MKKEHSKILIIASIEEVSVLRKFAILFLLSSIIPMSLLSYVFYKNTHIASTAMLLMCLGVLVGYFAIRSLIIRAITIAKENRKAIEPYLSPETIKELNSGKNELVVLSKTFSAITQQLDNNIKQLQYKNEELKALDQLKDDLVNKVSHEFRLPLTIIQESIRQISEGMFGPINEEQKKYFNMSLKSIDRLKNLIDNMLDISKIKKGKFELIKKKFDFTDLVKEVIAEFSQKFKTKNLELQTALPDQPLEIYADKDKINQVLINLISNAYKFTEKGLIKITASTKNGILECSIEDTGIGINAADINSLFSDFHQIGQTEIHPEKGTGLGLVISKGIIELHEGQIFIKSAPHKGTKFSFTLPLLPADTLKG